jgi:pyridoxamine 5'-phosphate oxidase
MTDPLSTLRQSYAMGSLDEKDVDPSPFRQFQQWLDRIRETSVVEANAMVLATVDAEGRPSARTVLLKGFDHRGLVFFTHYDSPKGREIDAHPEVAIVFYWPTFERQVRITGIASKTSTAESDAYFDSRPAGSQVGAAASRQSTVVGHRDWLEKRFAELTDQVDRGEPVQRPERWGGYRIMPLEFEFWQGRPNRLHDRIRYRFIDDFWKIDRLAP